MLLFRHSTSDCCFFTHTLLWVSDSFSLNNSLHYCSTERFFLFQLRPEVNVKALNRVWLTDLSDYFVLLHALYNPETLMWRKLKNKTVNEWALKCRAPLEHKIQAWAPTHASGDDGKSQVVGVHDVRHEQEVHVAAVTGQQNYWVLLDGLLQLEAELSQWECLTGASLCARSSSPSGSLPRWRRHS